MSKFLNESVINSYLTQLFPCIGLVHISLGNIEADAVLNKARACNKVVESARISFWEQFETSVASFDEEFKQILFSHSTANDEFIIISDALGEHGIAFRKNEFDTVFDSVTEIDFFQREDYIVINVDLRRMLLIHHSGYLFQLDCNEFE